MENYVFPYNVEASLGLNSCTEKGPGKQTFVADLFTIFFANTL